MPPSRYLYLESVCPLARSLSVVGDPWTLLVLRDVFDKGRGRFAELEESLTGISPNVLSARLKKLVDDGVLEKRSYSEHPPRSEYVLTPKGRALGPILKSMRDWGRAYPKEG